MATENEAFFQENSSIWERWYSDRLTFTEI
jgi:hypothetical protein